MKYCLSLVIGINFLFFFTKSYSMQQNFLNLYEESLGSEDQLLSIIKCIDNDIEKKRRNQELKDCIRTVGEQGWWLNPNIDLKEYLKKTVASLKEHSLIDSSNGGGSPELHQAVSRGDFPDVARILYLDKRDVNSRNCFGQTPLHIAVIKGIERIFFLVLAFDPDLNMRDFLGRTPYDNAISANNVKFAKLLKLLNT